MKDQPSARAGEAWSKILTVLILTAVAGIEALLHGGSERALASLVVPIVGGALLLAWLTAVRFLMMETRWRWFWVVILIGAAALVVFMGTGGVVGGTAISGLALALRTYSPWRLVSARRRALGFGLGLVAVACLVVAQRFWDLEAPATGPVHLIRQLGAWSLGSLLFFWLWSLLHLALRMRLHFLRLRPKLAVSAILIGLVPLLLMVLLGVMVLYTGLGGARAARVDATLEQWRRMADSGTDLAGAAFDTNFVWPAAAAAGGPVTGGTRIAAPAWVPDLARALDYDRRQAGADSAAAVVDTTGWFLMDRNIWLLRWQELGGPGQRVAGWQLGDRPLNLLSRVLRTGVHLNTIEAEREDDEIHLAAASAESRARFPGRDGSHRESSDEPGFWQRDLYFGGTLFELSTLADREISPVTILVNLKVNWRDLKHEFLEGENNLNKAVVVALGLVAFLFLVIEVFALFFGIRISEGIVSAVHELHRGTKKLGAGDLDTVIAIPNQDEFGDLAVSFNEMTVAMKKGREDALARERLTRELDTAREIQERLLPAGEPHFSGIEITGASIPSREVGGDYFDFLIQGDDHLGVAVGDVSGKGMPAALLMSNLQASLHGQVIHPSTVAEVVERVNDLLVRSTDPHMFATFFYGLLNISEGSFTCTNAGHNPPLLLRTDGGIETLGVGGLLLGMMPDQKYRQETVTLAPGEVVVLYTDGITEAVGPSAEEDDPEAMFGDEALVDVVRRNRHLPAVGIKEAVLDAVAAHTAGVAQSDDITLVVIRRPD